MNEFVIFSSPTYFLFMTLIILGHVLCPILRKFKIDNSSIIFKVIPAINIVLHLELFVLLMFIKATPEELFMTMAISATIALATSFTDKKEEGSK